MRTHHNARAGFTLIEVMISISILALLTTVIAVSWRVAATAQGKVDAEVRRNRGAEAVADLLDKQIASIVPLRNPNIEQEEVAFFQGSAEAVRFVSRYSLATKSRAGLVMVEYRVERGESGDRLLSKEMPVRAFSDLQGTPDQWTEAETRELPLPSEAAQYSFSYLLLDALTQNRVQAAAWSGQGGELPIGIVLQAATRGSNVPPEDWTFRLHTRDTRLGPPFNPALPFLR